MGDVARRPKSRMSFSASNSLIDAARYIIAKAWGAIYRPLHLFGHMVHWATS
jgi:hypothetical protein